MHEHNGVQEGRGRTDFGMYCVIDHMKYLKFSSLLELLHWVYNVLSIRIKFYTSGLHCSYHTAAGPNGNAFPGV